MSTPWTKERLQNYIDEGIEENLRLDYKGADALAKTDGKKKEILKDISAMANSAGGTIIYGIREFDEKERRHLPERFDPVDQSVISREWLEQVINRIQPRIQNVVITPVMIGPKSNDAAFVVEIPQGLTAHQNPNDKRYYKRYNFESIPMDDYEIRDVMSRSNHAQIDLKLSIASESIEELDTSSPIKRKETKRSRQLRVYAYNSGVVYAQYIVGYLYIQYTLLASHEKGFIGQREQKVRLRIENVREYPRGRVREIPILPGTYEHLRTVELNTDFPDELIESFPEIRWEVYADNARPRKGTVSLKDLLQSEKSHTRMA